MNVGNAAAAPAAAPQERSRVVRILVLVDCAVLVIFGFIAFIGNLLNFFDLTVPVLAIYMCIFGLVLTSCEMNLAASKTYFGALHEWLGEAVFMIFVGTLGVAIWTASLFGLIGGFYSIVVGAAVIVDQFAFGRRFLNNAPQPAAAA
ncbi:putative COP1-associated protein [Leptomonas pyrrhocoris]|uniref:Putative COP1-associated protein n=1 Tax=Leptomonas pyrrhocoris TaxID=157538 RepID=A0A0N0VHJ8_LEPPY|nr:putative COP1-associated protein [Leptomonas pyrrhocoris]KPA85881.1 putative COP1-associated protein [Leptomonas pyrrhocoris]|eukprot:XP_015664320.1 putative COP1-associated protein [Leptomonas pyrrhocoris]